MRIYSESRLSPTAQSEPPLELGSVLIPRGSSVGAMVTNGLLNRVGSYWDLAAGKILPREEWLLDDRNLSMPPRRPALEAVAWLARNPDAAGIPKPSHLFIDLEGHLSDDDARESLAAAYYLRAKLPKTILVSTYSRWQGGGERLKPWAESDDAVVYSLYVGNRILRAKDPVDEWMRTVDEAEDELEAVAPGKARVAFVCPRVSLWFINDPQFRDLLPLDKTPLPLDFWRAIKSRLQKPPRRNGRSYRPWDVFVWGEWDASLTAHADVMIAGKV